MSVRSMVNQPALEEARCKIETFVDSQRNTSASKKVNTVVTPATGDKVQTGIDLIQKTLNDNANEGFIGDLAENTTATFEKFLESIDLLQSGNPTKISMGLLDILAEAVEFAALTGLQGKIIASIVGPFCTIVSSLLELTQDPPESQETMLKRVIDEALNEYTEHDLSSTAQGFTAILIEKLSVAKLFFDMSDKIGDHDRDYITDVSYTEVAIEFLAKLRYYIKKDMYNKDIKIAKMTAKFIAIYAHIAFARHQLLLRLSIVYALDGKAQVSAESARRKGIALKEECNKLLKEYLYEKPNAKNYLTYAQVHLLPRASLVAIETMGGNIEEKFPGTMMSIYNLALSRYVSVDPSHKPTSNGRVVTGEAKTFELPDECKFIVYGMGGSDTENENVEIEIFSLSSAGYVFASGSTTTYSRRVYSLSGGPSENSESKWTLIKNENDSAKVHLKNTSRNEFLFTHTKDNRVYTWREGNTKPELDWLFCEIYVSSYF